MLNIAKTVFACVVLLWIFFYLKCKDGNCAIPVAKTKALISFVVTEKLICAYVFAYADCWFSYALA